jgi:CheY-like chemotaxis protein
MSNELSKTDFEKFISKEKILIADNSSSSRVGIARALSKMGATISQMIIVDSYSWAEEAMKRYVPGIIVLDYTLDSRCALDLLKNSDYPRTLTAVVTSNNSQAAVAEAAEGDIDIYITKPYTLEIFQNLFLKAVANKLNPTEYIKTIEVGKRLLAGSRLDLADQIFEKACALDGKPTLAHFYRGQVQVLSRALESAQASYSKGLEYNQAHFKCLQGLYDTFVAQKNFKSAYAVLCQIIRNFPLSPDRFSSLMRLAVVTQSFEDIEKHYESFLLLERKPEELVKHTCAAMIVAAKHFLRQKQRERAFALFQRAAVSSGWRPSFLKEIILTLAESGEGIELDKYLMRYPAEAKGTTEFQALDYLGLSLLKPLHAVLEHGRNLIKHGHRDPLIYRILIQATAKAGFADTAEALAIEAARLWPEKKTLFNTNLSA